jgi:hypothetical protein
MAGGIAFTVGALFELNVSEAEGALGRLSEGFGKLQGQIDGLLESMTTIGREALAPLEAGLSRTVEGFDSVIRSAKSAGDTITAAMASAGDAAARAAVQLQSVMESLNRAATAGSSEAFRTGIVPAIPIVSGGGTTEAPRGAGPRVSEGGGGALVTTQEAGGFSFGGPEPIPLSAIGGGAVAGRATARGRGGLLHGMAPLIEAGGVYEAYKSAMQENYSQRQTVATLGYDPDSEEGSLADQRLRSMLYDQTKGTIFSEAEASAALRRVRPILGLTGQEGMQRAEGIFPSALRLGELSKMRGKGDVSGEAAAGAELAHLMQNFEPTEVEKSLDIVNRAAKATDTSILAQESIFKYGLPVGMAAGVDANKTLAEMAVAEQSLGATSTVGTGYAQFILGALKTKGGTPAHLAGSARTVEREFEHALKLEGEDVGKVHKEIRGSAHDTALHALGITDAGGKLLDVTKDGRLDEDRIKEQIAAYAATHQRQDTLNTLTNAFGVRGMRYAERYAEQGYIERERQQIATITSGQTVRQEQQTLSQAPLQQFEQMLANMNNIGNTLANTTLPGVNTALMTLNSGLIGLNDFLKGHPGVAEGAGYGLLGVAGLGIAGLAGKVLSPAWGVAKAIGGLFGLGGGAAAGGATAAGEGGLMSALWPVGLIGGIGAGVNWLTGKAADVIEGGIFGKESVEQRHKTEQQWNSNLLHWLGSMFATPAAAAENGANTTTPRAQAPDRAQQPAQAGPTTVNQTISITVNGVPSEEGYRGIISRITGELRHALETATGPAQGTFVSGYNYGSGP